MRAIRRHKSGPLSATWPIGALLLVLGLLYLAQRSREGQSPNPPRSEPSREATASPVIRGRVDYVFDGDTILVRTPGRNLKVRLLGIDAPERDQSHGELSREYLARRCEQHVVEVFAKGYDRYDRVLGEVYLDQVWINGELVATGHAWCWPRGKRAGELAALQQQAVEARRGLWSEPDPAPPWEHRRAAHHGSD